MPTTSEIKQAICCPDGCERPENCWRDLMVKDAAIEAIQKLDAPDLWQPIESQHDDLRNVLVFVPGSRIGDFQEEADMIHVAFRKNGSYRLQDEDHFLVEPSHWMPLPANPMKYRPQKRT